MYSIFDIYLAKEDQPESGTYAELSLPATPYEVQDAFDRLRLAEGEKLYWEITDYHHFEELSSLLNDSCGLDDLNILAQKLSDLNERQCTAFTGLLQMESTKHEGTIPISRLIDLAYSADQCHVAESVVLDEQLGEFAIENNLLPGLEAVPDDMLKYLDLEKIGRELREAERGTFVASGVSDLGGYVALDGEVVEIYKNLELSPKQPDYTILLEVSKGFFDDPEYDSDKVVQLKLPATPEALDAALTALDVWDWREVGWSGLDCKVPTLTEMLSDDEDIHSVNLLAQKLSDMDTQVLSTYKALLEVTDCKILQDAELLVDTLDNYILSSQFSSPSEVAKGELSLILPDQEVDLILPHLNLYQYGETLIQKCGGVLTDYGLVERRDGQPVQAIENQPRQDGPAMGGMSQ